MVCYRYLTAWPCSSALTNYIGVFHQKEVINVRKRFFAYFITLSLIVSCFSSAVQVYADDWILASKLPEGAEVVSRKWTYVLTSYTTSSSPSLSGWTKYDTKWKWGPWGSWSSWSDTKATASDSKEVDTRSVVEKYNYYRYAKSKNASTGSYAKSASYPNKYKYSFTSKLKDKSSTSSNPQSYKWYYDGTSRYHSLWQDSPFETKKTQYRYRTRSKVYTYYYKKTENKESSTYPSGSNISNIQEWVTYRYKSFTFDLNGQLDDIKNGSISGYGTADIYINGKQVANDVDDFYKTYTYGTTYEIKDIKALDGHNYDGIYSGAISGTIKDNTTVALKFHTNSYTITAISEDESKGTTSGSGNYLYGSNAEIKAIPKQGYSFSHWNNDVTDEQINFTVTESCAYTAYFYPNSYTVTFDPTDGYLNSAERSMTVTYNNLYGHLPEPTREKYNFSGWYTSPVGGTKIEASSIVTITASQTLYAQWSETDHTYTDWIIDKKETCEDEGLQHRECTECGYRQDVIVPATGHAYSEDWITIKYPTCTTEGEKAHKCQNCGATKDNTVIQKLNHNYGVWSITEPPTCEKNGVKQQSCEYCKSINTLSIPALGHSFSDEWFTIKEPTCISEGSKVHKCTVCGKESAATAIEKSDHTYVDWVPFLEPSCTESGFETSECVICGHSGARRVNAKGHQYEDEWTVTRQPTCVSTGEKVKKCKVCGGQSEPTVMEMTDHKYDELKVQSEATCTEPGIQTRSCTVCGKTETITIGAKGHSYVLDHVINEPTRTMPGYIKPGTRVMVCENGCGKTFAEYFYPEIEAGNIVTQQIDDMQDDQVTLAVNMSDNPGFSRFTMKVNYDQDVFVPISISSGDGLNSELFDSSLTGVDAGKVDADDLSALLVKYGKDNTENITGDVELFKITFKLKSDAPKGEYKISTTYKGISGYTSEDGITPSLGIYDSEGNQIMPQISEAVLNIEVGNLKGDVNQDHRVDILDCSYLGYKLTDWNDLPWADANQQAADVFTDGRITTKDGTRLAQIIAGYDLSAAQADMQPEESEVTLLSDTQATISVENATAAANTEVDIPVVINNNEGISGFSFKLNYDKRYLTPVAVIDGGLYDGNCITNLQQENIDNALLDSVNISWINDKNIYGNGILFMVKFLVDESVEEGQIIPLTLSADDGAICRVRDDLEIEDINIAIQQGAIETYIDEEQLSKNIFEITDVLITSNGETITDIPRQGDFDLKPYFKQNMSYSGPANIMAAIYDEDGALISLQMLDLTSEILNQGYCDIHIEATDSNISSLKVFIWDSEEKIKPLAQYYIKK